MMNEDGRLKPPKQPPDFSQWEFSEMGSEHVYPNSKKEPVIKECTESDIRMPSWIGYVDSFTKGEAGIGREYRFFGQDPKLKFWGMLGEKPLYGWFAVRRSSGVWEVFSFVDYRVKIEPEFGTGSESKTIITIKVYVYRRDHDTILNDLTFIAKR